MSSRNNQDTASPSIHFRTVATLVAIAAVILAFYTPLRSAIARQLPKPLSSSTPVLSRRTMATTTATASGTDNKLNITKRPWNARGHADHDWLYTFHTFSFASYYDPSFEDFGPLRVINEDRVRRGTGFGTHSHAEFLIWSYIVNGELEHKDSMGNLENLRRGEVQVSEQDRLSCIRHCTNITCCSSPPQGLESVIQSTAATKTKTSTSSKSGQSQTSAVSSLATRLASTPTR